MMKVIYFLFIFDLFLSKTDGRCQLFENSIYQVTSSFPNYEPAFSILTILNNGLFYEINNIANGQNMRELGLDIQFSTLIGYYECLNSTSMHLSSVGYLYKNKNIAVLTTRDRACIHDYYLYFSPNDKTKCIGQVHYRFFSLGSNPLDTASKPILSGLVANLTCSYLNATKYR